MSMNPTPADADILLDMRYTYDSFFAQSGVSPNGEATLIRSTNFYYGHPIPVSVARQTMSLWFESTMGRPMDGGNFLSGPIVLNTPQAMPSRFPNPWMISGGPDSIVAYVKTLTAQVMQRRVRQ